ncbi:VOC family protein [Sciscionella marina]|uniref:VOC family protein n=1 Tax=Sciscionella marina TaxID=508770 RepID=UPI00036D4288|nr:VOC family protein [Sciscionella marina]
MTLSIGMVTIDCADPGRLAGFWTEALGVQVLADYGEFVLLGGEHIRLGLQRVPEAKAAKNRVHLDLGGESRAAAAERLTGLGATVLGEHSVPGLSWTVFADPEGNEFCVGEHPEQHRE